MVWESCALLGIKREKDDKDQMISRKAVPAKICNAPEMQFF